MANSRYASIRNHELADTLLPTTYLLIRLDGKSFHAFSKAHSFEKPNDTRALDLMNRAAQRVMRGKELAGDCRLGFGESDEFSFVFRRSCQLYGRRAAKLLTLVTSLFTSAYVFHWPEYFPNSPLKLDELPIFDGRIVQYSTDEEIRDYFRWRQVDTHINNMYNTCFWSLVLEGKMTAQEATTELQGTISSQKQELLFSRFGINYNNLPPMFRKGSILLWSDLKTNEEISKEPEVNRNKLDEHGIQYPLRISKSKAAAASKGKQELIVVHEDLIKDEWWEEGGRGYRLLE